MPPSLRKDHVPSKASSPKPAESRQRKKKYLTVYDAVAGRASYDGFIPSTPYIHTTRDTASSTTFSVPPEEALFRRSGAPERYEEEDFYWADINLTAGAELPDSDLLKAVHAYAAGFYERRGGSGDFRSLDETALMGIGVLLEECVDVLLGESGERVFLEGERARRLDEVKIGKGRGKGKGKQTKKDAVISTPNSEGSEEGQKRKRRKIRDDSTP